MQLLFGVYFIFVLLRVNFQINNSKIFVRGRASRATVFASTLTFNGVQKKFIALKNIPQQRK
jgi:hypothetical protein